MVKEDEKKKLLKMIATMRFIIFLFPKNINEEEIHEI